MGPFTHIREQSVTFIYICYPHNIHDLVALL